MAEFDKVQVVDVDDRCPILPIVEGDGVVRAVIWPGMGATSRSMHRITLSPGSSTGLLRHPMEAVYYVISGVASVHDGANGTSEQLRPGSMAFVEPDTAYVLAAGAEPVELVGGPCPPDPSLYQHLQK